MSIRTGRPARSMCSAVVTAADNSGCPTSPGPVLGAGSPGVVVAAVPGSVGAAGSPAATSCSTPQARRASDATARPSPPATGSPRARQPAGCCAGGDAGPGLTAAAGPGRGRRDRGRQRRQPDRIGGIDGGAHLLDQTAERVAHHRGPGWVTAAISGTARPAPPTMPPGPVSRSTPGAARSAAATAADTAAVVNRTAAASVGELWVGGDPPEGVGPRHPVRRCRPRSPRDRWPVARQTLASSRASAVSTGTVDRIRRTPPTGTAGSATGAGWRRVRPGRWGTPVQAPDRGSVGGSCDRSPAPRTAGRCSRPAQRAARSQQQVHKYPGWAGSTYPCRWPTAPRRTHLQAVAARRRPRGNDVRDRPAKSVDKSSGPGPET